jgi:hypothetical protein
VRWGPAPDRPLEPLIICEEPTIEGLIKLYARGLPSLGLFSAEGGQFVGSYGMSAENRLRTATALSQLWDGEVIKRIRASEDAALILPGRRLSAHLMIQPEVAALLIADPMLAAQGLLSRILVSAPDSLIGKRLWHEPAPESDLALSAYGNRLEQMLQVAPPLLAGTVNELSPRPVRLSKPARAEWIVFADDVERKMAGGGEYEMIRGLGNKLAEHAARIAAVLAVVDDLHVAEISVAQLEAGIMLARYYASEALRLHGVVADDPGLQLAQQVLAWARKQPDGLISLPDIYQFGPVPVRNRKRAAEVAALLQEHGHLEFVPGGAQVNGKFRREVWRVKS